MSSVKRLGGVVTPFLILALETDIICPSVSSGSIVSSFSSSDVFFNKARYLLSKAFQPSEIIVFPLALKRLLLQSILIIFSS